METDGVQKLGEEKESDEEALPEEEWTEGV